MREIKCYVVDGKCLSKWFDGILVVHVYIYLLYFKSTTSFLLFISLTVICTTQINLVYSHSQSVTIYDYINILQKLLAAYEDVLNNSLQI